MTHLKVAVRVRPLSQREVDSRAVLQVDNGNTITITNIKVPEQNAGDSRERTRRFTFDFCFHQHSKQEDVFKAVESVVGEAVKKRCHSCVLAYGQSASGKTHTMMGFPHDPGLIPRLCEKLFDYLRESAIGEERTDALISYLEIYNEKVRDLLCKPEDRKSVPPNLKIRQHPKKGPYVQGLSEHCVTTPTTLLQLLEAGTINRRVASTPSNPRSSRSHAVLILRVFGGVKLTLVDLAGSERAGTKCGSTFREGANINKSLVALGNVISALAEDTPAKAVRRRFIPYRDSVLTWLLKDTLGASSDTIMIATVSPSSKCYSETVNTLRFGQRAKLIVSIPVVHEDPREKTIRELRTEIAKLRDLLKNKPEIIIMDPPEEPKEEPSPIVVEKLMPVINISSDKKPPLSRLGRTFSVEKKKTEVPIKRTLPSLRKKSIDKLVPKPEVKSTGTDPKPIKSKIDSIRRSPVKPRSQIVAAVTNRLYAKKKEVATDTSDIMVDDHQEPPKELMICSNARLRLKELTRKALKAHRSKNEETQTDLFPVIRVKEVSTGVEDLRLEVCETKNVETWTESLPTEDKEVECLFLDSFKDSFVLTRSCSTQSNERLPLPCSSFTKYLTAFPDSRMEFSNPIVTSSVNINISHNYLNGRRLSDHSEDSLEDPVNVCLSTPDLISNHNSLEPHAHLTETKEELIQHATSSVFPPPEWGTFGEFHYSRDLCKGTLIIDSFISEKITINIPKVCASEVFISDPFDLSCEYFWPQQPETAKPTVIEYQPYGEDCIKLLEPVVLKSIMKHSPPSEQEDISEDNELPDSLEYHLANSKKVRFTRAEKCHNNERMLKAMSGFLEEATALMSNLSKVSSKLESESEYDIEVTINDPPDWKRKRKSDVDTQTEPRRREFSFPVNKYDLLLEDSCRRLEEKLDRYETSEREFVYNPWDLSANEEDASIESNARTFSDYGSLPRRGHRKQRATCSPSAFLRQLTSMRKQVVETSREEMFND